MTIFIDSKRVTLCSNVNALKSDTGCGPLLERDRGVWEELDHAEAGGATLVGTAYCSR